MNLTFPLFIRAMKLFRQEMPQSKHLVIDLKNNVFMIWWDTKHILPVYHNDNTI